MPSQKTNISLNVSPPNPVKSKLDLLKLCNAIKKKSTCPEVSRDGLMDDFVPGISTKKLIFQ